MKERELKLLQMIRHNPYLSQQEMAEALHISRPTLANIISSLIREGRIVGRAYVLPEENSIVAIGGANVDRKYHVQGAVALGTSNPVSATHSIGGVARNIAENLGRLEHDVQLVTTAGKDTDWQWIYEASKAYMNLQNVEQLEHCATGSYTAIVDDEGELVLAAANMDVYDALLPQVIQRNESAFLNASCIIVDLNCPKETVQYLQQFVIDRSIPFVVVPVSGPKMNRLPSTLKGVTWFICNREEAEILTNISLETPLDFERALQALREKGAENIVITAGAKGVYGRRKNEKPIFLQSLHVDHVQDVTGAGDAFVAAVIHMWLADATFERALQAGLMNAKKTLESTNTVRKELTKKQLKIELEEI